MASDLELARDPKTPAEELSRLARGSDAGILARVVSNPNVPPDVFWRLAEAYPTEALSNPSFELFPLEDPQWLKRSRPEALAALMAQLEAPEWFIDQVIRERLPVHEELAKRVRSPKLMWRLLRDHASDKRILYWLARNPHVPLPILEHLAAEHGQDFSTWHNPNVLPYFVEVALETGWFRGSTPLEDLSRLPLLPESQLVRLAAARRPLLRQIAAASPLISEALLERLACDPSPAVREAVAQNARCPEALARRLQREPPTQPVPPPLDP